MRNNSPTYFTTGEFAELCGTTKETLFHYDRIGILKPRFRKKRYRYYTMEQFFDFDLIRVLKSAGSSLEEIRDYLDHYDAGHFLEMLKGKQENLIQQRLRLEQMEEMLSGVMESTQYALSNTLDIPAVREEPEEFLITVRLGPGEGGSLEGTTSRLRDHFAFCDQIGLAGKFPLGSIILKETLLAGMEEESYFFSKLPAPFLCSRTMVKPAGRYLTMLHRGDYFSLQPVWDIFTAYMKEHGLSIAGNLYLSDLVSYLASGTEENYIILYSLQVE